MRSSCGTLRHRGVLWVSLVFALCIATVFGTTDCSDEMEPGGTPMTDTRSSCDQCHAPRGSDGLPEGIENAHPAYPVSCVFCHGGDGTEMTKEGAHVAVPDVVSGAMALRTLSSVELDTVPNEYIQWVNPSDYRVVEQTCGNGSCHVEIARAAPTSIMTTFAGHFNKTRYYAGTQDDRAAVFGVRTQEDAGWLGVFGTIPDLTPLQAPALDETSPLGAFIDQYLETGCPRCHVWNFGPNDVFGDFRSSGCAGCHMVYENDGLSISGDPHVNHDDPPHPARHEITTAIPDSQCEHCHYRGNRIGTMYRGLREVGRLGEPENTEVMASSLHGRPAGFYVLDEDTTNDVDETPPDIHYTLGLACVDCHIGRDVHGDGTLYSAHDFQVGIECVDCHGTPTARIQAGSDGEFRNSAGDRLRHIVDQDGQLFLRAQSDDSLHPLNQLADLQTNGNTDLQYAHGTDGEGFTHLDSLECYACHTSWTQSCFGCHPVVDTRTNGVSLIDGEEAPGRAGGSRAWVTIDYFALGMGVDGQLTPMAPQEKMFFTVVVPCDPLTETCTEGVDSAQPGRRLFDQVVRRTSDGLLGMGFGPVAPHTTSSEVQPCDRCHLREDESNRDIVNETLGIGSGRFVIPDGEGVMYDLTQVVDDAGAPTVGMAHEGTDVLSPDVVQRMLVPRVPNSGLELRDFVDWEAP